MWSVSDFEFKCDVVGNELIVGALNPVDFDKLGGLTRALVRNPQVRNGVW